MAKSAQENQKNKLRLGELLIRWTGGGVCSDDLLICGTRRVRLERNPSLDDHIGVPFRRLDLSVACQNRGFTVSPLPPDQLQPGAAGIPVGIKE